jgi:Bacterial regulatory proteins, luxR family
MRRSSVAGLPRARSPIERSYGGPRHQYQAPTYYGANGPAWSANLIAQGRGNKEIARILSIAPETVKSHVKHIFIKLNVQRRAQAVSRAQTLGLAGTP